MKAAMKIEDLDEESAWDRHKLPNRKFNKVGTTTDGTSETGWKVGHGHMMIERVDPWDGFRSKLKDTRA